MVAIRHQRPSAKQYRGRYGWSGENPWHISARLDKPTCEVSFRTPRTQTRTQTQHINTNTHTTIMLIYANTHMHKQTRTHTDRIHLHACTWAVTFVHGCVCWWTWLGLAAGQNANQRRQAHSVRIRNDPRLVPHDGRPEMVLGAGTLQ